MNNLWIVTENPGEVAAIADLLKFDLGEIEALVLGSRELAEQTAKGIAALKWIDTQDKPSECFADTACQALTAAAPSVIIGVATPGVRAVLGKAGKLLDAPVASNVIAASVSGGIVTAERLTIDGKVIETIEMPSPACLLISPFSVQAKAVESSTAPAEIEEITAEPVSGFELLSAEVLNASKLKDAEFVVGVGVGIADAQTLSKAEELAKLMGAELGCSMPVTNELNLLPPASYIGWSGIRISPKLYLAFGISGASQHLVGAKNSQTIVVVNKDPKAQFFQNADYGIVADLKEAIPEFIRALS